MFSRTVLLALTLCTATACGPDQPAADVDSTSTAAASSTDMPPTDAAPTASASAPAGDTRAAQGTKMLASLNGHELTKAHRARMAGVGLAEGPFGLNAQQTKSFQAVAGKMVDQSQCGVIMLRTFEEGSKEAFTKRCGDIAALEKKVKAAKPDQAAKVVATACKIDAPAADLPKQNPWGLLTSALIADQMKGDPAAGPDEQAIAKHLVWLCSNED